MERLLSLYGIPFLEGFFVTLFLLAALLFLGRFVTLPKSAARYSGLPRIGGFALISSFLLVLFSLETLSFPLSWWAFAGVLGLALFLGVLDDYLSLRWQYQLLGQGALLVLLYLGGVHIFSLTHPVQGIWLVPNDTIFSIGFMLFFVWGIILVNTLNWLDGLDGLCGSLSLITYATFFALCLTPAVNQPPLAIVSALLLGCTLAFLVYNLPQARVFAGTTGVLFFGLTIFFLSVVAGTKIATALLVLTLPVLDASFVVAKRFLSGRSITERDQSHLHHVLLARGWSATKILVVYTVLTLIIAGVALQTAVLGKLLAITLVFSLVGFSLLLLHFPQNKESKSRRVFLLSGFVLVLALIALMFWAGQKAPTRTLVGHTVFALERATTPEAQAQGLSNRADLCSTCALLFDFGTPAVRRFWMKDMHFSIDVLWLDEDNRVVAKDEQLPFPSREPFGPLVPVVRVLELPSGAAANIQVGERLFFW